MDRGQRIGYIRVSSTDQNTGRQLEGVDLDHTFTEAASGKSADRPQLEQLLAYAREGDTVLIHSMDRLARNLEDLRRIVRQLTSKGVRVEFVKEGLSFTGEDSPMSMLMLSMMGAFAEFERALIHERQREGIALAKARGAYKGGKPKLSASVVAVLRERARAGEAKSRLAKAFGVSRSAVYEYLKAGSGTG